MKKVETFTDSPDPVRPTSANTLGSGHRSLHDEYALENTTMDIVETARWLNRKRVSAAPCSWLRSISISVDESYENYDYDMIGPRTRLRMISILEDHGLHQLSGNVLEGSQGRVEFPPPTRSLSSDPAAELERTLARSSGVVFATPTQVVLASFRKGDPELSTGRQSDLVALVREQPANLEKVAKWLRGSTSYPGFQRLAPRLLAAQEEGAEQRRRGVFHSELPR